MNHKCLNCGKDQEFEAYVFELNESATLKCPTCNAVFRIDAVMTDPGNKGEEEPLAGEEQPPEETPPGEGEEAPPAEPGAEPEPGGEGEELELTPKGESLERGARANLTEGRPAPDGGPMSEHAAYDECVAAFDSVAEAAQMVAGSLSWNEKEYKLVANTKWAREMHRKLADLAERLMTNDDSDKYRRASKGESVSEGRAVKPTAAEVEKVLTYALTRLVPHNEDLDYDTLVYLGDHFGLDLRELDESLREAAEKTEWKGDFATFNAKLFGMAGSLDLPIEQVEIIIQELTDAGALTLSKDKVELDLKKARAVLVDFLHVQHEKTEIEAGTSEAPPSAPVPAEEPVNLGTAPVAESEEDKGETEELEKKVERAVAKFFESVQLGEMRRADRGAWIVGKYDFKDFKESQNDSGSVMVIAAHAYAPSTLIAICGAGDPSAEDYGPIGKDVEINRDTFGDQGYVRMGRFTIKGYGPKSVDTLKKFGVTTNRIYFFD
jgi:hypothetical protein